MKGGGIIPQNCYKPFLDQSEASRFSSFNKDLANRWTDMILFYSFVLIGPWKVYNYFEKEYHQPP